MGYCKHGNEYKVLSSSEKGFCCVESVFGEEYKL